MGTSSPSQDIKMLEPYDAEILPLRLYPEELKAHSGRDISTSLFIAGFFTIIKHESNPSTH